MVDIRVVKMVPKQPTSLFGLRLCNFSVTILKLLNTLEHSQSYWGP